MAKRVVSNVVDFDMHNLFPSLTWEQELEEAAEGGIENLPSNTLREHNYGRQPIIVLPEYSGDFLNKLRQPFEGKAIEGASNDSLLDFSMPSEMLKHQEHPTPRILLDDFYEMARPGEFAGGEDLKQYWDRSWEPFEAPEVSEDLLNREDLTRDDPARLRCARIASAFLGNFLSDPPSPDPRVVVARYNLMTAPVLLEIPNPGIRTAMRLEELSKTQITTKEKGTRVPDVGGVTVIKDMAETAPGTYLYVFNTGSGKGTYTTVFQFVPERGETNPLKLHVRVSCSCDAWVFWGAQYNAVMKDYLYGKVQTGGPKNKKFSKPGKRDPLGRFLVCKHVIACLPIISKIKLEPLEKREITRLRRPPKLELERPLPKEKLVVPSELRIFGHPGKYPEVDRAIRLWPHMSEEGKKDFFDRSEIPGVVAYMAHRFPDDAELSIARLKDMVETFTGPLQSGLRNQARKYLRFWIG